MQSIPPRKKHCCRNIRSHGNVGGAATVFSMDMGNYLPEHAERAYGAVCSHGKALSFAIEKPCRCCHFTRRAGLTVSSGTARPSVQNDSNLPAVATCPCSRPPAVSKQERCPPPQYELIDSSCTVLLLCAPEQKDGLRATHLSLIQQTLQSCCHSLQAKVTEEALMRNNRGD